MEIYAQANIGDLFGSPLGLTKSVGDLVGLILGIALTISGIIFLFLILLGGFQIIAGAGRGDPQSSAKGKQAVTWALAGFIIVFTAYWIIELIETLIGVDFLTQIPII